MVKGFGVSPITNTIYYGTQKSRKTNVDWQEIKM